MSWESSDAQKFTKKADTPEKQELWSRTANSILANTQNKQMAIRLANAAVRDYIEPDISYKNDRH